jgi:predicted nuclease of predicted toxin-antitoxin system
MPSFLADENITRPAYEGFKKAGLDTVHIKYDLDQGGLIDRCVLREGRERSLTIITNDNKDFKNISKTELKVSSGVWCLNTNVPEQQIARAEKIREIGQFQTKASRKGTLVVATNKGFIVENCKTQRKTKYSF